LLGAALALSLLSVVSSGASLQAGGKVVSAKLTKTSFPTSQAGTVKLVYKISLASKRFAYLLSQKKSAKWVKVRSLDKKGSFKGSHTMTVKALFGSKPVKVGRYRVKISAAANSVTRKFAVTEPPATNATGGRGSGSDGSGDDGDDGDPGDGDGDPPPTPRAPAAFSKTSPTNGQTGLAPSLTLSWSVSTNADHYQYCVDTIDRTGSNICSTSSPSMGWAYASSTGATVSGLQSGKTYYWQVYAIGAIPGRYADGGTWFSFTVS